VRVPRRVVSVCTVDFRHQGYTVLGELRFRNGKKSPGRPGTLQALQRDF